MSTITSPKAKRQINLLRGWPSPDVLPATLLSRAAQRLLADPAIYTPALQYGPDPGDPGLRDALAGWLGGHFGVVPDRERICITGGASQSAACILQSFTDPAVTRAVWVIAPCYYLACKIFEDAGFAGRLRAMPEDEEGIDLEELERKIVALEKEEEGKAPEIGRPLKNPGPYRKIYQHVIYVVPTCANPSGKTMSLRRREGLVHLARKHDALVLCDDVYDFLQWPLAGPITPDWPDRLRLPRLCDIDLALPRAENDPHGFRHAVSNGSFSKIAGPGVRTGWVEASPAFALGLSKTGSTMSGGAPSQLVAAMLGDLVRSGELQRHIQTASRPNLQRRHRLLLDAIHKHLSPLGATVRESSLVDGGEPVYGGYFVWVTLPEGLLSTTLVSERALEEEALIVGAGSMFEVSGDEKSVTFDRGIRLCFSWEPEEVLEEGVARLASLLRRMRDRKADYEKGVTHDGDGVADAFK